MKPTATTPKPKLTDLWIADPPERWAALGFAMAGSTAPLGGVTIHLGGAGHGITAWALTGLRNPHDDIDGLPAQPATAPQPDPPTHPNGALALDHLVVVTPDFDRTAEALAKADMPLRRIRDAGAFRQGFRRLGPGILELVEAHDAPDGPACFWGLVVIVEDLEALASRLGEHLGAVKDAVQPGRRIATVKQTAGLSPHFAFMTPEPDDS